MGLDFLAMKAIFFLLIMLGALIGGFLMRKSSAFIGAIFGGLVLFIFAHLVLAIMPAKLTTNTKQYNEQQRIDVYSRHQNMPDRVSIEAVTFEELQERETERSNKANQSIKDEIL